MLTFITFPLFFVDEQKLFGVQSYMELNRDYVNDKILASNVEYVLLRR